jgi:hypothetical protein
MDRTVSIRLSEEEYEALCRLARAQVRKVSGQARWLIRTALESAGPIETKTTEADSTMAEYTGQYMVAKFGGTKLTQLTRVSIEPKAAEPDFLDATHAEDTKASGGRGHGRGSEDPDHGRGL